MSDLDRKWIAAWLKLMALLFAGVILVSCARTAYLIHWEDVLMGGLLAIALIACVFVGISLWLRDAWARMQRRLRGDRP